MLHDSKLQLADAKEANSPVELREGAGPQVRHNKRSQSVVPWTAAIGVWLLADILVLGLTAALVAMTVAGHEATLQLSVIWVGIFAALSRRRRSSARENNTTPLVRGRLLNWCKAALLLLAFSYVTGVGYGLINEWVAWTFALGACALGFLGLAARAVIFSLSEAGTLGTRVAIYGCGTGTKELLDYIADERAPAAHVVQLFDERMTRGVDFVDGYPVGRDVDELVAAATSKQIDCVMLNLPASAIERINDLVHRLERVNIDIVMAPSPVQMATRSRSFEFVGTIPTVSIFRQPMRGLELFGKVLIDRLLALVAIIILSPILLIACLLVKLESPGSALFVQKRRGFNNQPFNMFKLRSMYVQDEASSSVTLVARKDARVTRTGAILRRTSVDELPQLFNVLKGDMSLVGPRPHLWEAKAADRRYEEVVRRYPARHRVLPGITGLAQVRGYRGNGDDETEISNRVKSDLEYIDRWSLSLDASILVRTLFTFMFHKAY